ncbi:protein SFI1 homolog isoform X8 [Elephas maximus indicus]|uniref:protein SFI1 homolog isoform X8 n=1 Tax=Elephas maximus indicus TaxID=99487 RepID=UPI002116DD34|nr:protein SFI1 homolog isoform X8 [Elephas maximus indicus]
MRPRCCAGSGAPGSLCLSRGRNGSSCPYCVLPGITTAAAGQSGWPFPAESPACCLPGMEETLAMAPAGKCPECKSNTFSQGVVREAGICHLVAEDVSASRKPLGRESGKWLSLRRYPGKGATSFRPLIHCLPHLRLRRTMHRTQTHTEGLTRKGQGWGICLSEAFTDGYGPGYTLSVHFCYLGLYPWPVGSSLASVPLLLDPFCFLLPAAQAILHAEQWLLHRAWSTWQQQVAACHQERQKQAVACAHHRHWRVRRTFHVWRESAQGLRTEKLGKARAVEFHRVQLLLWAWKRWRECLALCDAERQKLVRADLHHQHSLLHRVLRRWMTYQDRVRHVLQEVAARESQHKRQLLRGVLHRWRENTIACVDEAQKASQARDHYRRTMCSKVLAQWREAASMQIYCRQQEDCAVSEARGVLARGCVQAVFQRWRDRSQSTAQQRVQMERAAQHHRLRLLQEMMAQWKAHHLGFIRKMLLQRQGTRFLAQRLSQSCFYHWRRQLVARREEQQGTARALWFWSFSLQAKVIGVQDLEDQGFSPACGEESTWSGGWIGWASPLLSLEAWDAWLGFVLERRRKKARLEQAMQAYHHQLLQEGVTHLLRFAAGVKTSRQQLQAQKQAQAAHSLHRAVRRCAMLWKQKVLGPARQLLSPVPALPNRRVTFEVPFPSLITAGAGDAALETKRPEARPERGLGSLALAAGDPQLLELNTARSARKQPRCPDFLLDPKQSQRPLGCTPFGGQGLRPEKAQEHSQGAAQPASDSLPRPFQVEAQTAPAPRNPLPQPGSLPRPRGRRLPSTASAGPELMLLPPSSFMLHGTETPARVSAPLQPHIPTSLAGAPDPHLLLPGDFTGTRACPGLGSEVAGGAELEVELEGIRQQLQHYQATKQNLWSCQRQASSLRRWLELSREEPRPEDQEAEQQMQKELEEVRSRAPHQPQGGSGSAPTQPAGHPLPTGGSTDPAPGCRAPGPTPACQCLHSPCPGPAAGPVLASLPQRAPAGLRGRLRPPPGTEHNRPQCSDVLFFYFFISNC